MELEKHQYVKFRREMDPIKLEQKHIEDVCYVYLYEDKIVTRMNKNTRFIKYLIYRIACYRKNMDFFTCIHRKAS